MYLNQDQHRKTKAVFPDNGTERARGTYVDLAIALSVPSLALLQIIQVLKHTAIWEEGGK